MCVMPEVFFQTVVKARKQHKCCECNGVIAVGSIYERSAGVWEGRGITHHTCPSCAEIRKFVDLQMKTSCPHENGPAFGELQSLIKEFDIQLPKNIDLSLYTKTTASRKEFVSKQFVLDRLYRLYSLVLESHVAESSEALALKEAILDIEIGKPTPKPRFVVRPGFIIIDTVIGVIVKCVPGDKATAESECKKLNGF